MAVFGLVLGAASIARPLPGQIPPRRMILTSAAANPSAPVSARPGGVPPRLAADRADDLADGTALPTDTRSVRIEREGEVIRTAPDGQSPRRGTAARGTRLPALEATQGRDCQGFWVRIGTDAWVCSDGVDLSADPPQAVPLPTVHDGDVVPYQYAFATHAGVRTYRRLEDVSTDDWADELERGMSVAVVGTARVDGGTYVHTASGRWVSLRDLSWAQPSERAGLFYDPDEAVDAAGFLRVDVRAWPTPEAAVRDRGVARGTVELTRRDGVHVRETRVLHGWTVVRLDGGWVPAAHLLRPAVPPPPADLAPGERWVDVDRTRQVMVAFEGTRPVFATLVSTGRPGSPTAPGEHRVWAKLATTDMSNVDDTDIDTAAALYTVSRVPWVMFFHNDQALHGAFWHDAFGHSHSHGCVNLAPRDAAWLYAWSPPAMPPGWTAVLPTAREPGLRVRVR